VGGGRLTVAFDAFGVVAGRRARVAGRTDAATVDTDGSTLAVIELGTAALIQLPCIYRTHRSHTPTHLA